jgi:U3 small nucleolar RNA-associated protein 14
LIVEEPLFVQKTAGSEESEGNVRSNLLEALDEESDELEGNEKLAGDEDVETLEGKEDDDELLAGSSDDENEVGENPWLTAVKDNVSRNSSRNRPEKEEQIDVKQAVAKLEVNFPTKFHAQTQVPQSSSKPQRTDSAPVRGQLGFDETPTQEELLAQAFVDAGAEQEFAEAKSAVLEREEAEYKRKHGIREDVELDGWGSWAGIVGNGELWDVGCRGSEATQEGDKGGAAET